MKSFYRTFTAFALGCGSLVFNSGCAEGPFRGLAPYNPLYRSAWEADEKYAQTFHAKRTEIAELASRARSASADEKENAAQTIASKLQSENNALLRQSLIRALGACPGPTAFQTLSVQVGDIDKDIRLAACEALGESQMPEAAQTLANVVQLDKEFDVRIAATRELGRFQKDSVAIRALGQALDDTNPALQYRAVQSLRMISGRDLGDNVAAWREFVNSGDAFTPKRDVSIAERLKEIF